MLSLLDVIEHLAKQKGWWYFLSASKTYINVSAAKDADLDGIVTIYANDTNVVYTPKNQSKATFGEGYTMVKIYPGDPQYLEKVERLIVER